MCVCVPRNIAEVEPREPTSFSPSAISTLHLLIEMSSAPSQNNQFQIGSTHHPFLQKPSRLLPCDFMAS